MILLGEKFPIDVKGEAHNRSQPDVDFLAVFEEAWEVT